MREVQTEILAAALDNLVRYSVTGCGQAARRAADLLDRLSEAGGVDGDMRRMYGHLSETLAFKMAEPPAAVEPATACRQVPPRAWLTWEWDDSLGRGSIG